MSKAIEDLKHEHEAIITALKILDTISDGASRGTAPGTTDLVNFIGFLKEFADTCHHGKEEGILFPALVESGMSERTGPIAVMLAEHVQGRNYIQQMDLAVAAGPDYASFVKAAQGYSLLLKNHIQKENDVLFVMAENVLEKKILDRLYVAFEEHEEKVIGHGRHEELHEMLKGLRARYLK